ncbi:MAG: class I SAM-dependent methyltransferase, partial [Chloroflexi bacterium]|nr:class I SAM-dependent methyltransferase [Chloroflexota bacterium]
YDAISYNYRTDDGRNMPSDYAGWLAELTPLLPKEAAILELGCGCGVPVGRILAPDFDYTGVDISSVQIKRARQLVKNGKFFTADMSQLQYPDERFAAIVSFYAIIHLPLDEQPALLANICRWLQPGGYFMATVGHTAWTGTEDDWLGAEMYWSATDTDTYQQWLTDLGFTLFWTRFIPEGDGGHTLFLAQKCA